MSTETTETKRGRKLGLVGAACVACCTGPLLVTIGGLGTLGSVATFLVWPTAGLAVAAATVAAAIALRRHRRDHARPEPVSVQLNDRPARASSPTEERT